MYLVGIFCNNFFKFAFLVAFGNWLCFIFGLFCIQIYVRLLDNNFSEGQGKPGAEQTYQKYITFFTGEFKIRVLQSTL